MTFRLQIECSGSWRRLPTAHLLVNEDAGDHA